MRVVSSLRYQFDRTWFTIFVSAAAAIVILGLLAFAALLGAGAHGPSPDTHVLAPFRWIPTGNLTTA